MTEWGQHALSLVTALACGLLVGIERGFDLRGLRAGTRVAGVRTFTLLGLAAGLAGLAGQLGQQFVAGAIVAGCAAVLTVGYAHRPGLNSKPDATTPIAALTTVGLGFIAGFGEPGFAIAGAAVVTLILALKAELHGFLDKLDEDDIKALARYAVIALTVLPFLPSGRYGPLSAWNPQKLWLVVVLVTGFSFLGYVANRIFGERNGTIATAVIGGLYSSTAVTQALAQRLGSAKRAGAEPAGIALASTVMYLRIPFLVAILATRALSEFVIIVMPAFIVGVTASWIVYRRSPRCRRAIASGQSDRHAPGAWLCGFCRVAAVAVAGPRTASGAGDRAAVADRRKHECRHRHRHAGGLAPRRWRRRWPRLLWPGRWSRNGGQVGITLVYARAKGRSAAMALGASRWSWSRHRGGVDVM